MIRDDKANTKIKRVVLLSIVVFISISVIAGVGIFRLMMHKAEAGIDQLNQMVLYDVELKEIPDGEYEGIYEAFPVMVKVRVSVSNHSITDIRLLEHRNGQGKDAEVIVDTIIKAQSVKVDAISGATYSSKVIQKAVEIALSSSLE